MSKKKQREEELIQTHVINLVEIRNAEKEEKHERKKKKPIVFSIMGVLLIAMGFLYPSLISYFSYPQNVIAASKLNRNTLTCISNIDDTTNKVKVYTKSIYTFNNNELYKSESNTTISSEDINYINGLRDKYNTMYISNNNIKYDIHSNNDALYFNTNVNYNNIDYINYNDEINKLTHTVTFKGVENMETVKTTLESLGNLCN